ncbi:hypothetical protein P186_1190 [Pyrobaculum ferrireducens]|uniref:Uncharacterized protein n=1 Tax=Pyrobaculum ferrireducens TaxID=1104324 RepID=G7VCT2_9CREN|nr:hypothetical protein P186_1190 [Pyrobaculum ferrireducens]
MDIYISIVFSLRKNSSLKNFINSYIISILYILLKNLINI